MEEETLADETINDSNVEEKVPKNEIIQSKNEPEISKRTGKAKRVYTIKDPAAHQAKMERAHSKFRDWLEQKNQAQKELKEKKNEMLRKFEEEELKKKLEKVKKPDVEEKNKESGKQTIVETKEVTSVPREENDEQIQKMYEKYLIERAALLKPKKVVRTKTVYIHKDDSESDDSMSSVEEKDKRKSKKQKSKKVRVENESSSEEEVVKANTVLPKKVDNKNPIIPQTENISSNTFIQIPAYKFY